MFMDLLEMLGSMTVVFLFVGFCFWFIPKIAE